MTTVTANNVLEGQLIGDWLVKTVDGKPCNVVELQGTVGASVAIDRKKGFADAIAKASNIKIIRSQSGDFTRSKGKEVMESFIKAENNGKNICMVFAHNDDMAIGAIQAIKEAGLKPGYASAFLKKVWADAVGFCGSELIRRSVGLSHVADIDTIQDDAMRHECLRHAITLGRALIVLAERIDSVDELLARVRQYS